jgi:replication factor C subunit 1
MRFVKEIQAHMRLRASGDRHEIRQQYLPVLWYRLIQALERQGKDSVDGVIRLMDSYFLTKDDWDAILELGLGPMAMESVKIDTQTKSSFTRLYNQQSHPLPFMKATSIAPPKKSSRDKPDLEEAIEGSEDEDLALEMGSEDTNDDEISDLKKDKYVKQSKKKLGSKKSSTKKVAPKSKEEENLKNDAGNDDGESDEGEGLRLKKGKGGAKGKAITSRGRLMK